MRSRSAADDRGGVAAEFAVALPAVVLVLGLCVGAVGVGSQHVRLQDAAADAARGLGRGESAGQVTARAAAAFPGVRLRSWTGGDLVCARLTAAARGPAAVAGLELAAESCAVDGGR
ncbi:TadE family protein [Protaetiibacter mangrovi]|uniref:Pilus assembly protein n=1 Tax=Protaetiibacter mangrovi TaxID=2970926 RepID=A0ABT1ZFT0_9MICO|nr:TadE family protein [Protaetiibacter mangrovi]MCS0499574.1 pilus assembly protein [Protaetiibacter mangrovi]TPX03444.1 pilus assembly protein [Schumannella luteola]